MHQVTYPVSGSCGGSRAGPAFFEAARGRLEKIQFLEKLNRYVHQEKVERIGCRLNQRDHVVKGPVHFSSKDLCVIYCL